MPPADPSTPQPSTNGTSGRSGRRRPAASTSDPRSDGTGSSATETDRGRARSRPRRSASSAKDPLADLETLDQLSAAHGGSLLIPAVLPSIVPAASAHDSQADDVRTPAADSTVSAGPSSLVPPTVPPPPTVADPPPTMAVPVAPIVDASVGPATKTIALVDPPADAHGHRAQQRPVVWRRTARPRVRRVTRVVRHVDTWSVFKVAVVFNLVVYLVCLTAGVLLWNVAHTTGTVDNVEKFFEQFGWASFEFKGGEIYHNAWVAGLFVSVGLTGFAVLLATLFNLITDLVGGIRVSVLEEEVVARGSGRATRREEAHLHGLEQLEQGGHSGSVNSDRPG